MKKKLALSLAAVMCVSILAGCGSSGTQTNAGGSQQTGTSSTGAKSATPTYSWQMASTETSDRPVTRAMQRFADAVYEATDGDIKIEVVADGLLGDYTTNFEELMLGSLEMQANTISTDYDDRLSMTRIPYLCSNYDEVTTNMSEGSFFYDGLNEVMNDLGVELLSNWPAGFQGIGGKSVGDVSTLFDPTVKQNAICRVPSIVTTLATCEAFGFQTVTIGYSDLYSALQTGICDCWMGGTDIDTANNFPDVSSIYIYANYILATEPIAINKELYDSLPQEYQRILKDCAEAELVALCEELPKVTEESAKTLEELGIETYTPSDEELDSFAEYVRSTVWVNVKDMLGEEYFNGLMDAFNIEH